MLTDLDANLIEISFNKVYATTISNKIRSLHNRLIHMSMGKKATVYRHGIKIK